jgi:spermidine synthase
LYNRRVIRHLALGLMVASGFAALGYQIVWTQQAATWLGHEAAAVLAVVAAFFGGLALGALVLGPRIDRSEHPARWYAACEALIGLWCVALAFLMGPVSRWLLELTGAQPSPAWQWSIAFFGTFALLAPATAAMGATLPAMERALARLPRHGASIAVLYAGNTFGAVLGVLATAFWLVPQYGLARTAAVCAALNLAAAAAAVKLFPNGGSRDTLPVRSGGRAILLLLAATGLLGIGYEVLAVRVLSQVAENTVYTFALLLAVYLVGTALGTAAYERWRSERVDTQRLLLMLAVCCLAGTASLWFSQSLKNAIVQTFEASLGTALAAEAALALAAFLLPTVMMGAVFSHLATKARAAGIGFGHALGVNTLGAALAPLLFGVLLAPALGTKNALLLLAACYLVLSWRHAWFAPSRWVTAVAAFALAAWAPTLAIVDIPPGGRLVSYEEGALATVSVVEDASGVARLHINNRQQEGSSATAHADSRQALLPLLLHPSPRRALFLGLGTGVTAAAAAEERSIRVDAVELLPEVIRASRFFIGSNPDIRVMAADARRFVRAATARYDVIVSDNFHPARSGSGALYTVEHFSAVRERLAAGGLFCQWLPLHQLDLDTLRSIVRAFIAVHPRAFAMLATYSLETPVVGLVALEDGGRFDAGSVRKRAEGMMDELALFGSFLAGPSALARFAGNAPVNTDDRPVVAYAAPRITYVADSRPRDRLVELLRELEMRPNELVAGASAGWKDQLAAYWTARNRFIEAGRDVRPTADVQRMLSQVREPLLSVLRTSPDFSPAYDPLLRMALALASTDTGAARELLTELQHIQPSRPEATQGLLELAGRSR